MSTASYAGDRYAKLAPRDLVITLRSLPRRVEETIGPVRSDPERFARRNEVVSNGESLTSHVAALARHMNLLESEISRISTSGEAVINGAALSLDHPAPEVDRLVGLDAAESSLVTSAEAIGGLLDGCSSEQWTFRAPATNGVKVTLLDLAQHAARIGAEGLRSTAALADQL